MGGAEALAIFAAAVAAGGINAVVGSGSLITFPTLLAFGFPAVIANVSNNVGLVSGNVSGAFGYRRELAGQRGRLVRLGVLAAAGSLAGAILLLSLPASAFTLIVPVNAFTLFTWEWPCGGAVPAHRGEQPCERVGCIETRLEEIPGIEIRP